MRTPQKPSNAFHGGVRRVSYLLIAFMAAMVPLVVASSGLMTHNWGQARLRGAAARQRGAEAQKQRCACSALACSLEFCCVSLSRWLDA
jgi:hypothetical protein